MLLGSCTQGGCRLELIVRGRPSRMNATRPSWPKCSTMIPINTAQIADRKVVLTRLTAAAAAIGAGCDQYYFLLLYLGPRWASWNIGVFVCIRCAGIHRNLGVHISKMKSVNLDTWAPDQIEVRLLGRLLHFFLELHDVSCTNWLNHRLKLK